MADKWTPETPWVKSNKKTQAYWPPYVCRNPNCASKGKSHPNCHCGAPSFAQQSRNLEYAHGGSVESPKYFCDESAHHQPGCEYYMADGGEIPQQQPTPQPQDDIARAIGMAAVHHGMLGLLKNVGHSKLAEPEKHKHLFHDMKEQPLEGEKHKLGHKLSAHLSGGDHEGAADLMNQHPVAGSIGKNNLKPILGRLSGPMMMHEPDPEAFKSAADYLHSSIKGSSALMDQVGKLNSTHGPDVREDKAVRDALISHLDEIEQNPESMLDVGGSLGHYLPDHASGIAAHMATAVSYLNSLKPKQDQAGPLDEVTPVDKMAQNLYDRQIDLAQNPMLLLRNAADGTIQPSDMMTVNTIYPGLYKEMVSLASEEIIDAKSKDMEIPYRRRMGLSLLLGMPLEFSQTPQAAQAIIMSATPPQEVGQNAQKQKQDKATAVEMKQINKVDEIGETPLEARAINKRTKP